MSKIPIYNPAGAVAEELEIADDLLVLDKGDQALHDTVVAYLANQRAGTASTLGKGQVSGSNKKPWQQKGLGRARAGYRQSPVWRGGGVIFGPMPRSYRTDLPRKVVQLAFRRALSERIRDRAVRGVDAFPVASPKTRDFLTWLKTQNLAGKLLIVSDKVERNLTLATRNVGTIEVARARDVNAYQLMRVRHIVASRGALDVLKKRLSPGAEKRR
ncbi:MAG: 50S ribosomal protein L4 [Lentisphaerae bacterium]|nr:50S ribosomal protein L4 [Lentisphaerota bacterium]